MFHSIKRKKWKSFEDAVKRIEKVGKINGKKEDKIEQKVPFTYLKQNQIKINQLLTLKTIYHFHLL